MKTFFVRSVIALALALALVGAALSSPRPAAATYGGPLVQDAGGNGAYDGPVWQLNDASIGSNGLSAVMSRPGFSRIDSQYHIRGISGSANSTVTLQLYYSNDNTTGAPPTWASGSWVAGPVLLAATLVTSVTNTSDITQTLNVGYYTVISYTTTTTNPVWLQVLNLYK